jgi:hypothetical protein
MGWEFMTSWRFWVAMALIVSSAGIIAWAITERSDD